MKSYLLAFASLWFFPQLPDSYIVENRRKSLMKTKHTSKITLSLPKFKG